MPAGTYNLVIEQGATFSLTLTVLENSVAKDLTGFKARAEARTSHKSSTVLITFTAQITDPTNGVIVLSLTPAVTKALDPKKGGVWDLELEDVGGDVIRLLQGIVTISPEVTKET